MNNLPTTNYLMNFVSWQIHDIPTTNIRWERQIKAMYNKWKDHKTMVPCLPFQKELDIVFDVIDFWHHLNATSQVLYYTFQSISLGFSNDNACVTLNKMFSYIFAIVETNSIQINTLPKKKLSKELKLWISSKDMSTMIESNPTKNKE
jgi:hypothetical protein